MTSSASIAKASYFPVRKKSSPKPAQIDESCELTKNRGRPILSTMDARGIILRNRRNELGLKMEQAAELCGVRVSTISRMEAGKMPNASFDTWVKVSDALGLDLKDLAKPAPVLQPV